MKKIIMQLTLVSLLIPGVGFAQEVLSTMTSKNGDKITLECESKACSNIIIKLDRIKGKDKILNTITIENSPTEIKAKTKNEFLGFTMNTFEKSLDLFCSQGETHNSLTEGTGGAMILFAPIGIAVHGTVAAGYTAAAIGMAAFAMLTAPVEAVVDSLSVEKKAQMKINKKLSRGEDVEVGNRVFESAVNLLSKI
jgi:hypothetical protein